MKLPTLSLFIETTINAHLSDHSNDPGFFALVKAYQVYAHSRTCWKYNTNECRFSYGRYFTENTIIVKPLDNEFNSDEKQQVLYHRKNTLKKQVKSYNDDNLNPAKMSDLNKDNCIQPLSVKEITEISNF